VVKALRAEMSRDILERRGGAYDALPPCHRFLYGFAQPLEHFPIKWTPLDRQKMRPNKDLERRSDAIGSENALTGVSPASGIRWQAQLQASGDVTLMELKAKLQERGASFSVGALWRFFDRRGVTVKKNSAVQAGSLHYCKVNALKA
jgi:hypothetical protein